MSPGWRVREAGKKSVHGLRDYHRGMAVLTEPLGQSERIALRRARRGALRGTFAFALALGLGIAALLWSLSGRDAIGVFPLVALLGVGWAWLLRRMPARLVAASRDLRRERAEVVTGPAALRQRRGIGVFAPTHSELLLDGGCYPLTPAQAMQVREGMAVVARIAPDARVLLSVAPDAATREPRPDTAVDAASAATHGLTPREVDLLRLIVAGRTDKAIARELGLEPTTVRTYNSQLYAKLGVGRRTEAVARAHALGLVTNVGN